MDAPQAATPPKSTSLSQDSLRMEELLHMDLTCCRAWKRMEQHTSLLGIYSRRLYRHLAIERQLRQDQAGLESGQQRRQAHLA